MLWSVTAFLLFVADRTAMPISPLSSWSDTYQVWLQALNDNYRDLVAAAAALLPKLLGAVLVLVVGWLLAVALRTLALRLGRGLDRLYEAARQRSGQTAALRWPLSRVLAWTVYWLILVFFLIAAVNILGLPGVPQLLAALLRILPAVLVAAVLLLVVYLVSALVAKLVTTAALSAGLAHAAVLGRLVRIFIMVFAAIIAIGHLGIDVTLLVNLVTVVAALAFGAAALAFGLGAAPQVRNIIATSYVRQTYRVGQRVRIDELEGEILEFTPVAVVLDAPGGRTAIPTGLFSERVSVLVEPGPDDD